jgi:hypothetical protein
MTRVGIPRRRAKNMGLALVAALVLLLLASPVSAGATGILDQQQTDTSGGGINVAGDVWAQTFTAGRTGAIDQVDLGTFTGGVPVPTTVEIRSVDASGTPTQTVLGTATSEVPPEETFTPFAFSPPVPVTAGTQYAIVTSAPEGPDLFWEIASGDAYAGGQQYARMFLPDETFVPGSGDFAFKTYVTTVAPTSKSQCKNGGWHSYSQFKNQGQCVSFVQHQRT